MSEKVWGTLLVAASFFLTFIGSHLFWSYEERLVGGLVFLIGLCFAAATLHVVAARERKRNEPTYYPGPAGTITEHPEELGWPT